MRKCNLITTVLRLGLVVLNGIEDYDGAWFCAEHTECVKMRLKPGAGKTKRHLLKVFAIGMAINVWRSVVAKL